MAQVKIYGVKDRLEPIRDELSEVIHGCPMEALGLPAEKRFHRFFGMERADFFFPADRTERYTIVELSMFAGRSAEVKKRLLRLLFERIEERLGIAPTDLEVTIFETPRGNWGIRGLPGDEVGLGYRVEV